jgi:hypothetical protein
VSRPADGRCRVQRCRRTLPPEETRGDLTSQTDVCTRCARIELQKIERLPGARRWLAGQGRQQQWVPERLSLSVTRFSRMLRSFTAGGQGRRECAPLEGLIQQQSARILLEAVQFLPAGCRRVLTMRFALEGGDHATLEDVGLAIGRSKERARQLEAEGLHLLRVMLEGVL